MSNLEVMGEPARQIEQEVKPKFKAHLFQKGHPKLPGAGRVKGVPNSTTIEVKKAIEYAFQGMGGHKRLLEWADANPTEFYRYVWSKLIPQKMDIAVTQGIGDILLKAGQQILEAQARVIPPPALPASPVVAVPPPAHAPALADASKHALAEGGGVPAEEGGAGCVGGREPHQP
jgi:hypothetical protein